MTRIGWPTDNWKKALGTEKGEFLSHFWHEEQRLTALWTQLRGILKLKRKDKAILNETIPELAQVIVDSMWRNIIVSLCVFIDSPGEGDKRSVSFKSWIGEFGPTEGTPMYHKLERAMNNYSSIMTPILAARNKHIAHTNRQLLLSENGSSISIKPRFIQDAMDSLKKVIDTIFEANQMESPESDADLRRGDFVNLVQFLSAGLDSEEASMTSASGKKK